MKTKNCKVCGKEFSTNTLKREYCADCKVIVKKENMRRARENWNATAAIRMSADTEEMRNCCLNCTRPKCGGECEELAKIARGVSNGH